MEITVNMIQTEPHATLSIWLNNNGNNREGDSTISPDEEIVIINDNEPIIISDDNDNEPIIISDDEDNEAIIISDDEDDEGNLVIADDFESEMGSEREFPHQWQWDTDSDLGFHGDLQPDSFS